MAKNIELKFTMKNLFNPEESLSKWIIKLAIARNDLLYSVGHLMDTYDNNLDNGERFYFFRLGVSHLREAIKFLHMFSGDPQIISFIDRLNKENQDNYDLIRNINADFNTPGSLVNEMIKPIRDHSFHYYEQAKKGQGRDKKYERIFEENLQKLSNLRTGITINGTKRYDIAFTFADEINFHLIFGSVPDPELFKANVEALSEIMYAFIGFSDDTVGLYMAQNMDRLLKITTFK